MKWSKTRRGQSRTRRTRQFARYHSKVGPVVGAVAIGVGAGFASYYGGPAAGAAVTAGGSALAYQGGRYWGATAARAEGESGREARAAGRQVGRRAAGYAAIGGAAGTLTGWGYAYATDGGFYAPTTEVAYAGGAAEGEAGEVAALGAGAGTTTETLVPSTASASYGITADQAGKALDGGWKAYQAYAGSKADPGSGGAEIPYSEPFAMGGGGAGGGGDAGEPDPLGAPGRGGPESIWNSTAMKVGLVLLGLSLVFKGR